MGMRENQLKWNTFFEIKILGRIAESVSLVTGILYVGAFIHKQNWLVEYQMFFSNIGLY